MLYYINAGSFSLYSPPKLICNIRNEGCENPPGGETFGSIRNLENRLVPIYNQYSLDNRLCIGLSGCSNSLIVLRHNFHYC